MQLPNLLNLALTVIPKQIVQWYTQAGNTVLPNAQKVSVFAAPVDVVGSFQPVPRNMYEQLGLELNKEYVNFYTSTAMADLSRIKAGDEFVFVDDRYKVMSKTEWMKVNGWNGEMAVKLNG